jgi:hypothetical protein
LAAAAWSQSFYLTAGEVKGALKAGGSDTQQHERQGLLIVSDSRLIHVGLDEEINPLTAKLTWTATVLSKKEVSLVVARDSFAILNRVVVDRLRQAVRVKGFCAYLQEDLEGLSEEQKRVLFTPQHKILLLAFASKTSFYLFWIRIASTTRLVAMSIDSITLLFTASDFNHTNDIHLAQAQPRIKDAAMQIR